MKSRKLCFFLKLPREFLRIKLLKNFLHDLFELEKEKNNTNFNCKKNLP